MKPPYPKLFDGPSPSGEGSLRGLERTPAAYLTSSGEDWIARKNGPFRSVEVTGGEPYLWVQYPLADLTPDPLFAILGDGNLQAPLIGAPDVTVKFSSNKAPFGAAFYYEDLFATFVGDGYLITYMEDNPTHDTRNSFFWPSLEQVMARNPRFEPGDPDGARRSVDFYIPFNITGLRNYEHWITTFACGFKDDDERFIYGFACNVQEEPTPPRASAYEELVIDAKIPRMFIGSTKTRTMHEVTLPDSTPSYRINPTAQPYQSRCCTPFTPYCVGRGKLQYLQAVQERAILNTSGNEPNPVLSTLYDQIAPFMVKSSDFGETWTLETATFLTPYLKIVPASVVGASNPGITVKDRDFYSNAQLYYMTQRTVTSYLGEGKVATFIPAGYDSGASVMRPMLFIGDAGSVSLPRVAWPADDWLVADDGANAFPDSFQVGWIRMARKQSAHFSFGVGCLCVPFIPSEPVGGQPRKTGWRVMFTTDFGATWSLSSNELPLPVQQFEFGCPAPTIIEPYRSSTQRGRIAWVGIDGTAGLTASRTEVWTTDGAFETYNRIWRSKPGIAFEEYSVQDSNFFGGIDFIFPFTDFGSHAINFGNAQRPPSVFPAFPGEFEINFVGTFEIA